MGHTWCSGLLLRLCSDITPGGLGGPSEVPGLNWIGHVQGKHLTHCIIALASVGKKKHFLKIYFLNPTKPCLGFISGSVCRELLVGFWGPHGVLGIEPRSASCKASALTHCSIALARTRILRNVCILRFLGTHSNLDPSFCSSASMRFIITQLCSDILH